MKQLGRSPDDVQQFQNLPPGWAKKRDHEGNVFYINKTTSEHSVTKPFMNNDRVTIKGLKKGYQFNGRTGTLLSHQHNGAGKLRWLVELHEGYEQLMVKKQNLEHIADSISAVSKQVFGIGEEIPNFICQTQIGELNLHEYIDGSWTVLFTQPNVFDPVHTTEMGMAAKIKPEFDSRNCKMLGLTIASLEEHDIWMQDINMLTSTEVNFPLIADEDGEISKLLGMIDTPNMPKDGVAKRFKLPLSSVIILDIDRTVQMHMVYSASTGRNFYEVLRALDSLQMTLYHQCATPAHWKNGEDVFILQHLNGAAAKLAFPSGFSELKPYYRVTPQPDTITDD